MTSTDSGERLEQRLAGVLLGTAVGDALGLPAENLSPARIRKWWKGQWRMRLLFGRGMISDDTEHTLMVAQALLEDSTDQRAFQRVLSWKFRWWFAALPGGVGLATAKACLRLWLALPADKAAVASAGSGPAMRSAIIGAYFARQPERRREFVLASSRLTHRGWQAEVAAQAVAECVALAMSKQEPPEVETVLSSLRAISGEPEWQLVLSKIEHSLKMQHSVPEFVQSLGLEGGVSGYSLHVMPVAIYAWLWHAKDFRSALTVALDCGGDTDTLGAILGAIMGATVGRAGIPEDWLYRICDWPRSVSFIGKVAARLAQQRMQNTQLGPVRYFRPGIIPRNILFIGVILFHGFRRMFPPY
jgi:ADP-ribosylglycohydrolase